MKAVKAVIDNGQIVPEEPLELTGRYDAIVVVLDVDPWDAILNDPRPRPELVKARQEAEAEYSPRQNHPSRPGHDAVKSIANDSFWELYRRLPDNVRRRSEGGVPSFPPQPGPSRPFF